MIKKISNALVSNREILIVAVVLMVLMMMVIPLSTTIMDFIIAFNISVTIMILMVVIYLRSPISLTSFPTILLFLTLIRIGITVSTSRLILLNADAGEIVTTFGEFVVGGNMVVGIVIFIVITIINFIVIAKGSERVAEVAARFSLDAMPGSQMSIDSDLKAGNITIDEAIAKRKSLGLESKLYGAMDGAMKFVKGDAIASMIDVLINIIGGLIIGMVQHNMDFSHAMTTYSILTVGDGLVQQIPALIISLTAGMLITRVSDESENENLGNNLLRQIFQSHKAIFAACGLIVIMAITPGMPGYVFMSIFACLITLGIFFLKKSGNNSKKVQNDAMVEDESNTANDISSSEPNMNLIPLMLYLSSEFKNSNEMSKLKKILSDIQQNIISDLGVLIPPIVARFSEQFKLNDYQLLLSEIPILNDQFHWKHILLLDNSKPHLAVLNTENSFVNETDFGSQHKGIWIDIKNTSLCNEYQLKYLSCESFLTLYFKYNIKKHISEFLGMQEIKNLLDKMSAYQDLIKELLRMMPLNKITEIFQRLVSEDVSIRNFKVILDSMLEWCQREKEIILITEYVRRSLGRYIAYKFSNGNYMFASIMLSIDIENMIRDSIRFAEAGSYLSLDPQIANDIVIKITQILEEAENVVNIAIITQMDIRRYVRSITEKKYPYIPVLSFQELEGFAEFNSIGIVELDEI